MEIYGTITPNWQLHIPVKIRKQIGLKHHGCVKIKAHKKTFSVIPEKDDILALAGKYKVKNPIPADKIRDYIDYSDL